MQITRLKIFLIIALLLFIEACAGNRLPNVRMAEEPMVTGCQFLETISENSDPGRLMQHLRCYDTQGKVIQRADNLGATHIVWLYQYRIGSAALVYRCKQ